MSKKYYFNIHKQRKTAINSVFALILMLLMFVNSFIYFTSDVYAQEEITRLGESIANFGQSVSNIQNTATKFTFNQVQNAKEISSNASNTIKSAINNAFAFCKNKASKVKNKITNKAIQTKNYLSSNISNLFTSSEQSNQPQQLTITNEGQVSIKNIENVTQIEQVTQVEKVIKTTTLLNEIVNPADLTSINNELDSLSGKIDNLANQISNKINYSTPSYAPVSVSSSGIQVSGHSLLSSLNVSGSGSIGGSLSVRQNFSIGNTKDNITPTFNVYADSTFNNSASFNSGLSATTLSVSGDTTITGALTLATSTIAQLTITNDLLVSGNATTTGSFYIGADLNVVGDMGILDTDVPDTITASNYLLLTGGTLTGGLTMLTTTSTNSTSTNLYISNDLTVGGNSSLQKATSTFLYASGDITSGGSFYGSLTGNADTATNLADYSSAYTWTGINTFSSDVRITGALHATTTDFDSLMVNGSATTTGSFYIGADLNVVGDMGILDTDVPDTITASNYLLLTGGTLTGGLTMLTTTSTNSTSTNLYISNDLTVGGDSSLQKATSTFLYASGDITSGGSFVGSLTGNADTATNLADYSSAYTWTGINTFSSDVRITGALHATTTDFDLLMVNGSATTTGSHYIGGTASTTELFVQGLGHFGGNFTVDGNSTTSGSFAIGTDKYSVFSIDSNGDLNIDLNTANATTTISDNLVIVGNLGGSSPLDITTDVITYGRATTTDRLVLGTTNPTTDAIFWLGGDSYTSGNATTTGSLRVGEQVYIDVSTVAPMVITNTTAKVANLNADLLDGFDSSAFGDATAANQVTILARIGINSDSASMSDTLFAGQQYIADNMGTASNIWTNATRKLTKPNIECPSDMVYVESNEGGFCIDKYEASPDSNCTHNYSGTGNPADQAETLVNLDDSDCAPQSVSGGAPWISISQGQAALACAKAGKRLPTNKEWFYAALGTPDYDATDPADNSEECHIWNSGAPGNPTGSTYIDHDDDANNAEAIQSGSASACVSTAGAYDMVGNVWEWVSDSTTDAAGLVTGEVSSADYIDGVDGDGLVREVNDITPNANYNEDMFWYAAGNRGFFRGGNWSDGANAGVFALILGSAPSSVCTSVGFRCAR